MQQTAARDRALAKNLLVTRLVHQLGYEEALHFKEILRNSIQPFRREVPRDKFDLGQKGAELARCLLEIVGQAFELAPRNVARRVPLARLRFLVQRYDVVGP